MNSPHHPHHDHHDVHQQRLIWFFSFCNQRSSSSSSSSSCSGSNNGNNRRTSRRKSASNRNKFAIQYQQQLQQQKRQSSNVFGLDLVEHTRRFSDDDTIPYIVKSCTKFIEKHGIIFGIYRLSGMRVNIHKLRQDFDKNPQISMIDSEAISNDAHAVACVLKQYFRELPVPLMTFHMYEKFIELFKQSNNNNNNNNNNINTDTKNNKANTNDTSSNVDLITEEDQEPIYDIEHDSNTAGVSGDGDNNNDDVTKNRDHVESANFRNNNNNNGKLFNTSTSKTTAPLAGIRVTSGSTIAIKTKSSPIQTQPTRVVSDNQRKKQSQFTTSASDSQLISLSSVVTTTTADVKYQVRLEDLKRLLQQLPRANHQTLKYLMRHLALIAANGEKTGMDSKNVAIVWAPNLLKPRELELSAGLETLQVIGLQAVITEQLIKHHRFLFDDYEYDTSIDADCKHDCVEQTEPKDDHPQQQTLAKSDAPSIQDKRESKEDKLHQINENADHSIHSHNITQHSPRFPIEHDKSEQSMSKDDNLPVSNVSDSGPSKDENQENNL